MFIWSIPILQQFVASSLDAFPVNIIGPGRYCHQQQQHSAFAAAAAGAGATTAAFPNNRYIVINIRPFHPVMMRPISFLHQHHLTH